jgi:Ca2+-binding RTX toxin-like protein
MTSLPDNDTLNGGTGNDSMSGAQGNDVYIFDAAGDKVVESQAGATGGTDTVHSSVSYTLGANVEKLVLTGSGALKGTGNGLANTVTGNAGANVLDGKGGADTLNGLGGNDTLVWATTDKYDGGTGTADKLRVTTGNLNLTTVGDANIKNVEQIDLTVAGGNKLTLKASDILAFSSDSGNLKVLGGATDTVDIVGAFTVQGASGGFRTYKVGTATLLVDTDISVV